jgi:hypothetical protein
MDKEIKELKLEENYISLMIQVNLYLFVFISLKFISPYFTGYRDTARMLVEAGISLSLDLDKI